MAWVSQFNVKFDINFMPPGGGQLCRRGFTFWSEQTNLKILKILNK